MRDKFGESYSKAQGEYDAQLPEDNSHQFEQAEEAILGELWENMDDEATVAFISWLGPELIKKGISLDKLMKEWVRGTKGGQTWLGEAIDARIEREERYREDRGE